MLNTPLARLRRSATRYLTLKAISEYFAQRDYPRAIITIGDFERGKYLSPPDRFVSLYAAAIGQTVAVVREALERTQRMRVNSTGPFNRKKSQRKRATNSC